MCVFLGSDLCERNGKEIRNGGKEREKEKEKRRKAGKVKKVGWGPSSGKMAEYICHME